MDVALLTPRYPPNTAGGGEISARMLAEHLADEPRVRRIVVLSFDGAKRETRGGVEVRRLRDLSPTVTEWQNLRAYRPLRRHADEFDLLHAYNMELHPVAGRLTAEGVIRSVGTLNSYHFLRSAVANATPGWFERLYELIGYPTTGRVLRHYLSRIDRFIAISSAVRGVYADNGLDADRIDVIPNMYDPSFSVPEVDGHDGTVLLYVGRLSERKGVRYLIRAMVELPPEYRLRVVGDGPRLSNLRSTAAELGLSDRVTFVGRVPYEEVTEQYAAADVFVHPGVWPEPFGRTVIEAIQAGIPVVCTDIGGPADIVRDPQLRVPPGDPTAIAAAVRTATEERPELGPRDRAHVAEAFAPEVVTERVVDLYEEVLASRSG